MTSNAQAGRTALFTTAVLAAVAAVLLWGIAGSHPPGAFDRTLFAHLHGNRGDAAAGFATGLTWIGDGPPLIAVLTTLGLAARAWLRTWSPLLITGGAVAGAAAASTVSKMVVDRARPPAAGWLTAAHGTSFPSGHTTVSTAGYLALGLSVGALLQSPAARAAARGCGVAMAFAIGWTRVELSVHWPSDVLAGWGLGTCAACVAVLAWPLAVAAGRELGPAARRARVS